AQDLDAIKANILNNTPIGAHAAGPAYDAWVEQGYTEARARLPRVTDRLSYFYALAAYVNGFRDPHLSLNPSATLPPPRWPGFIAARQHDGVVVAWRDDADANAPPLGAHIVSCDGRDLDALAREKVFAFVLNPDLPEGARRAAPRLFLDTG